MIEAVILISLISNNLLNINPVYNWLLNTLNLNHKPFNCTTCLSMWLSLAYALVAVLYMAKPYVFIALPFITPFVASAIDRWYNALPIKF